VLVAAAFAFRSPHPWPVAAGLAAGVAVSALALTL
jgi:hypothetical protein